MTRKRRAATRVKDWGRKRKPRRPPAEGWTLNELAAFAEVSPRTISAYMKRGLLTAPEFRGTATRYQRVHLIRLLAIRLMKARGTASIKAIKLRLEAMGNRDIEAWVLAKPLKPEVHAALNVKTSATKTPPSPPHPTDVDTSKWPTQTWRRVELMPGLELSLRADASPLVRQIATHVYAQLQHLVARALRTPGAPKT